MEGANFYLIIILALIIFIVIYRQLAIKKLSKQIGELKSVKDQFANYKSEMEYLEKYKQIVDAESEAERIRIEVKQLLEIAQSDYESKIAEAEELAKSEIKASRESAKSIKEKAESALQEAHALATKIESEAIAKAEEIAGDAWDAKKNAEQYSETVKAMKNIIKGYGDEYLIPNESVLDDLAAEYDHKEAGEQLKQIRTQVKSMIKNSEAADCDYVEPHRRTTAIDFVLDAFNGKVDTIMAKVKHDNYGKLSQQLNDAYRIVNHNGKPFRNARVTERYFDLMEQQLKMAVAVSELKRQDMEEQKRIRDEIREEERARREYEKAIKAAEKEEKLIQKAMKDAEAKLSTVAAEEREKYESMLADLKTKLEEAEANGQRALSMAQQTKQGHVYVISNIGSFGEDVFKIGMTRRLEPLDRVKELGDASVPFSFDVHAMIHSDDAPKLEKLLHSKFNINQVNRVNPRKEFFRVNLTEIKSEIEAMGIKAHWTMKADAMEYRESMQLSKVEGSSKGNLETA
jgi:hypothetical protein